MRYYRYRSPEIIIFRIAGIVVLLIGLALSPLPLIELLSFLLDGPPSSALGITVGIPIGLLFWGWGASNLFPDIATDSKGIYVRFFYIKWLFVPWENVIFFRESLISFLNPFPGTRKHMLVMVKSRLTLIHWYFGLSQLSRFKPGFLISTSISGYHELARTITEHIADD